MAHFCSTLGSLIAQDLNVPQRGLIVGGDHAIAMGSWAGVARALEQSHISNKALGLIWIDAHLDSHRPETSLSGKFHGMSLAHLLGDGDQELAQLAGCRPALEPKNLCLIGCRSFETAERAYLARKNVRVYPQNEVDRRGFPAVLRAAVQHISQNTSHFGLSIDLDAFDPQFAPGVGSPVPGGLVPPQVLPALQNLAKDPRLLAVELAEYNPELDPDGRTAELAVDLISSLFPKHLVETHMPQKPQLPQTPFPATSAHCAHNYDPVPVMLSRGSGSFVFDENEKRYIDMLGAYSAVSFGHCNRALIRAMTHQAAQLDTISRAFENRTLYRFLAAACRLTGFDQALPMNSGTEAVETALKAARKWGEKVKGIAAGKTQIIAAEGNFHGRSIAITGLSTAAQYRDGFGPFPAGLKTVPFGDADALKAAITPNTAAFLIEPIQGEGGIIFPPEGYLKSVSRICKAHNVLLICDEIQTGLGRTGHVLAYEHDGIRPDAITLGKALGGGLLPVSLFLARKDVMAVFTPGDHGSTFGGNPIAAAVGLEALKLLETEKLADRSAKLGAYMLEKLRALPSPLIRELRGRGLFIGMEFHADRVAAKDAVLSLLRHGILTKDTHKNTVRFAPPLTIRKSEIDTALVGIAAALADLEHQDQPPIAA